MKDKANNGNAVTNLNTGVIVSNYIEPQYCDIVVRIEENLACPSTYSCTKNGVTGEIKLDGKYKHIFCEISTCFKDCTKNHDVSYCSSSCGGYGQGDTIDLEHCYTQSGRPDYPYYACHYSGYIGGYDNWWIQ